MKKFIKVFLSFLIPASIAMLFWVLIYDSIFIFITVSLGHGMLMGIGYLLLEFYVINKIHKNIWIKRLGLFSALFVVTTILYFMLNYQEVIRPIKTIFNNELPLPSKYYDDYE